jgi:hypothetical protein
MVPGVKGIYQRQNMLDAKRAALDTLAKVIEGIVTPARLEVSLCNLECRRAAVGTHIGRLRENAQDGPEPTQLFIARPVRHS